LTKQNKGGGGGGGGGAAVIVLTLNSQMTPQGDSTCVGYLPAF